MNSNDGRRQYLKLYSPGMVISERVSERMKLLGFSQAELARRVGVSQPTIFKLLRSSKKGSTKLHVIARTLKTTPAYLTGETDDPSEGAPPPAPEPTVQFIMMPVALPSTAALTRMFEGLLEACPGMAGAELAHELATLLPIGLGTLKGPLIEPGSDRREPTADLAQDLHDGALERRRA